MCGTAPFALQSVTVGQGTMLVRNDDYIWGSSLAKNTGPAHIAKITFREIAEVATVFLELKTGGVDMPLHALVDLLSEVKKEPNLAVLKLPGQDMYSLLNNVIKAPFYDDKVREAVAKAINQKESLA